VGLVLVVSRKFGQGGEADWLNMSLAIGALFSITIGTLYQKRFVSACDVRSANAIQLGAALLVTLPLMFLETESMRWNAELVGAMTWSVMVTLGGSSLLYLLIQRGAATSVASLMYLVPPSTALLAWLLFAEPITAITIGGTALTAFGVSLVVRPPRIAS
jgi:drug/metabolite transporter (DMT)-like permease